MAMRAQAIVWLASAFVQARVFIVWSRTFLGQSLPVFIRHWIYSPLDHDLLLSDSDQKAGSQTLRAVGMPDLTCIRTNFRGQTSCSTAVLQINSGVQLEVSGQPDLQLVEVGLIGQRWSARIEHPSQDVLLSCKRQLKSSTLTLEQLVPAGKAYLIPCPAFKVDRRAVLRTDGDGSAALSSRTQAEYSCLTRRSLLTQTLYSGTDRQHKLKAGVSTDSVPLLVARTKLRRGWVHSAAVAVAPTTGTQLQLKSRPGAGQKYSLTLHPQQQMAVGSVQLQPEGGSTKLTATAACSLCDGVPEPKLALDLTWSL